MSKSKIRIIARIFAILVLIVMIFSVIQSLSVTTVICTAAEYQWGDKFYNDTGQYICACDDVKKKCIPCIDILPNQ